MNTPKGFIDDSVIALLQDEEVIKKLETCKTPEEGYEIVKDKVSVSFEEFQSMMIIANELLTELNEGLLSDDDLESIAGGKISQQELDYINLAVAVFNFIASA